MSSGSETDDSSQNGIDAVDHIRRAEEILAAGKRRKIAQQTAVETEYRQRVERAHAAFHDFLIAHQAKVSESQASQFRRLNHALHKRQNLEIEIWKQITSVEKSTRALASLLTEICNVRLEVMAEISTSGRIPRNAPNLRPETARRGTQY